jgi:hypothetical protein
MENEQQNGVAYDRRRLGVNEEARRQTSESEFDRAAPVSTLRRMRSTPAATRQRVTCVLSKSLLLALLIALFLTATLTTILTTIVSVHAAEVTPETITLGDSVIIKMTPGALGLVLNCDGQSYRYLGDLEQKVAYKPSNAGVCTLEETQADNKVTVTSFTVFAIDPVPSDINISPVAPDAQPQNDDGTATTITGSLLSNTTDQILHVSRLGKRLLESSLEEDEIALSRGNPALRIHSARGTSWIADITIHDAQGRLQMNTMDLGVTPSTNAGRGDVSITLRKRHVKSITLENADTSTGIDLGFDEPAPSLIDGVDGKQWVNVYAIDPTNMSFTTGTVTATAEGTELYKCKDWDFAQQTCAGTWMKIQDITPGLDYSVTLSPADPGFAESVAGPGVLAYTGIGNYSVLGSIPAPDKNTVGTFGVVVTNPGNTVMNITRISVRASGNVFSAARGIKPLGGWQYVSASLINWSNASGVIVNAVDAGEFIVNITGVNANVVSAVVTVNATTNIANLSNSGYTTQSTNTALQYPLVYFVNSSNASAYVVTGILQNASNAYTIRVHNRGTSAVAINTLLHIYIPPGWKNVDAAGQTGWTTGTIQGDDQTGWFLRPRTSSTILAAGWRDFVLNATPPDADNASIYTWRLRLVGPSASNARAITTTFEPALDVSNQTVLLTAYDGLSEITRNGGGAVNLDQYLSIPSPTDSPGPNRWAVVVVNPYDYPVNVTSIYLQNNQNLFAAVVGVVPASTWSVSASQINWTGNAVIPAHDTAEFSANITATAATTTATIVTVVTTTTDGTLTTSGFRTGQSTGSVPHLAMYLMSGARTSYIANLTPNARNQFTLRIDNAGASAVMPLNTQLEIWFPPGWTNVDAGSNNNWSVLSVTNDATGGGMIRAISNVTLAIGAIRVFTFNATTPNVGTNSTYRIDAQLIGATGQNAIFPISVISQFAGRIVATNYGINLTRYSESVTSMNNVTSIHIRDVVSAYTPTIFNLSLLNATSGRYNTALVGTITQDPASWNITLATNRTFDVRDYIDRNASSQNYGKILIRWQTASGNQTALIEDLLEYNTTLDVLTPDITLIAPDDYINASNITFIANTSDDYDLRNCTLYLDGIANRTNSTPSNGTNTTFYVTGVRDGQHNWSVLCRDLVGNVNWTANASTIVDTVRPSVTLGNPQNNTRYTTSVAFTMTPYDANPANCTLYIDGIANTTNNTPTNGSSWTITHIVPDGNHTWNAGCFDYAGNNFTNYTRNFSVDRTLPGYENISVSPPSGPTYNQTRVYQFNISWTDLNGIANVSLEANFTGLFHNYTMTATGSVYTLSYTPLSVGEYQWRSWANDTFGNR